MNSRFLWSENKDAPKGNILFHTKLNIPPLQQKITLRTRLINELNTALKVRLTLVAGPAGFGKTTAAVSWIRQSGIQAAWFSIDDCDNSLKRFWSYLIASLGRILPGLENRFSQYLYEVISIAVDDVVTALVDEIYKFKEDFILVLDDYHLIKEDSIHKSIALLLKYMPENAHVVIISRTRPPFVSIRLQTVGDVKEISIADLQFTTSEIADFCEVMGIFLSSSDIKTLESNTEGWAAGLFLILDSMGRGSHFDFHGLLPSSGLDKQRIFTYLAEEVMNRWAGEEKEFMLKTSILSSMSGPLCDELTGRADGKKMLERLSAENAFIIPTDNEGCWYRYHHLYSEYLYKELNKKGDISVTELHERAGTWYVNNGYFSEAVHHFLQGGIYEKAAALIEKNGRGMLKSGDFTTLIAWFGSLPIPVIEHSDMLCLTYAWALMLSGRAGEEEPWIEIVDSRSKYPNPIGPDEKWKKQVQLEVLAIRGIIGIRNEDPQGILKSIIRVKEMANESIFCGYGLNLNIGEAYLIAGMLGFKGQLSIIDREISKIYEIARRDVIKYNFGFIPALMGELFFEMNCIDKAVPLLVKAVEEAENSGMAGSLIPSVITLARIMKARGDMNGAFEMVREGERKLRNMGSIHLMPVLAAFRARLGIECGDNDAVTGWLRTNCLDIHDSPSMHRMYEQITLARALIAGKDYDNALLLLSRLLLYAEKERNLVYTIEILNLQAILCNVSGQTLKAMELIRKSLELGEKEGYERIYAEEGIPMSALLGRFWRLYCKRESAHGMPVTPTYIHRLLKYTKEYCIAAKAFVKEKEKSQVHIQIPRQPLTRREKEILRFLYSELTNAEIAYTLDISINTVKVNCTNIYRKLDVRNREQALKRAREMDLLN